MSQKIIDSLLDCDLLKIDEESAEDLSDTELKIAYNELIAEAKPYDPNFYNNTFILSVSDLPVPFDWNGDESDEILIWDNVVDLMNFGVEWFADYYNSHKDRIQFDGILENEFTVLTDDEVKEVLLEEKFYEYENFHIDALKQEFDIIYEFFDQMEESKRNINYKLQKELPKYQHFDLIYRKADDVYFLRKWIWENSAMSDTTFLNRYSTFHLSDCITARSQLFNRTANFNKGCLIVPFEYPKNPYTIHSLSGLLILIYEVMDLLEKSVNPSSPYDAKLERMIFTNVNDSRTFDDLLADRVQALSLTLQADLDSQALYQKMKGDRDFELAHGMMKKYAMIQTILSTFGDNRSLEDIFLSIQALLDYENTNEEYYKKGIDILEIFANTKLWTKHSSQFGSDLKKYARFSVEFLKFFKELGEENGGNDEIINNLQRDLVLIQEEIDEFDVEYYIREGLKNMYYGYTAFEMLNDEGLDYDKILEYFGGVDIDAYARYVLQDRGISEMIAPVNECENIYFMYV